MRPEVLNMHVLFSENTCELLCLLDGEGTFQFIWTSGFNITGYRPEELEGKSQYELIHPEDIKPLRKIYNNNLASFVSHFPSIELRFRHKKGFYIWMELSIKPVPVANSQTVILASWSDITERVKLKNDLHKTNSGFLNLKRIVNQSALVLITNLEGGIIDCNNALCKAAKYPIEELLGVNCTTINSDFQSRRFWAFVLRLIRSGKLWQGEMKNIAKDGTIFWTLTSIAPVYNTAGKIHQYCAISNLITERKEFEAKLMIANEQRQRQNHRLNEFSYITSHNIRGPIATMKGLLNICDSLADPGQVFEMLNKMKTVTHRLDETVNDMGMILAVSNEEQHKELIDLNELVEETLLSHQDAILKANAVVLYDFHKCPSLYSVKKSLKSIMEQLLSNSLKYAKPDVAPLITIKCDVNENNLQIIFSDNGLGIDLKFQSARIFTLYRRFHTHVEGKGIGLYLVRSQIELLGGTIHVESEPGKGAAFIINFRLSTFNGYVKNFIV